MNEYMRDDYKIEADKGEEADYIPLPFYFLEKIRIGEAIKNDRSTKLNKEV